MTTFAFTGEALDASGLTFLRARYLSTSQGRFLTADTWLGQFAEPQTLNQWNYALSNPVNYTDPSGHVAIASNSASQVVNGQLPQQPGNNSTGLSNPCIGGYWVQVIVDTFGGVRVALVPCQSQSKVLQPPQGCSGQNDGADRPFPFQVQLEDEDPFCEVIVETYAGVWASIIMRESRLERLYETLGEMTNPQERQRILQEIFALIVELDKLHTDANELLELAEVYGCDTSDWNRPPNPGPPGPEPALPTSTLSGFG